MSTHRNPQRRSPNYIVREGQEEVLDLPACETCGTVERLTARVILGSIPITAFYNLAREYEERWPGCLIEPTDDGYRIIGPHACQCRPKDQPTDE